MGHGVYSVPGAGGTIIKLNRSDGSVVTRINPFGASGAAVAIETFTASPLVVDGAGNVYYDAVRLSAGSVSFYDNDVIDSWLIKVAPDNTSSQVSYSELLTGHAQGSAGGVRPQEHATEIKGQPVPGPDDPCELVFALGDLPWPPSPTAMPPTAPCGSQRRALNVAPAIAPDGTIYTVSRAQFSSRYNYLIAINPDLTGKWAASLRGDSTMDATTAASRIAFCRRMGSQAGAGRIYSQNDGHVFVVGGTSSAATASSASRRIQ